MGLPSHGAGAASSPGWTRMDIQDGALTQLELSWVCGLERPQVTLQGAWVQIAPGLGSERGVQEPVLKSRDPDDLVLQILQHVSQPAGELGHTIVMRTVGLTSPRGFPLVFTFFPQRLSWLILALCIST